MTVSGPNSNQPIYKQEFEEGVKIFEDSFKNYQSSTFDPQKDQYKKLDYKLMGIN